MCTEQSAVNAFMNVVHLQFSSILLVDIVIVQPCGLTINHNSSEIRCPIFTVQERMVCCDISWWFKRLQGKRKGSYPRWIGAWAYLWGWHGMRYVCLIPILFLNFYWQLLKNFATFGYIGSLNYCDLHWASGWISIPVTQIWPQTLSESQITEIIRIYVVFAG